MFVLVREVTDSIPRVAARFLWRHVSGASRSLITKLPTNLVLKLVVITKESPLTLQHVKEPYSMLNLGIRRKCNI